MKSLFFFVALLAGITVIGQNEFANQQFYNAFNRVVKESATGFQSIKGSQKQNVLAGLVDEYRSRFYFPGVDSTVIMEPIAGSPTFKIYLKKKSSKIAAQQQIENLRLAIQTAVGKTVYEKRDSSQVKQFTFYESYFYLTPSTTDYSLAVYKSSFVLDKGFYHSSAEVIGTYPKEVKTSKLSPQPDLDALILSFYTEASGYFVSLKGEQTKTNASYTDYKTLKPMFGVYGELSEGKLEIDLRYSYGFTLLSGLDEANMIYEQIKSSLLKTLAGKISFDPEKQSAYNADSYSVTGKDVGKSFIATKNHITITVVRNKDYPAVYLTFNRKKY